MPELSSDPLPAPADPPPSPGLAEVGRYATEREAAEHGLVVLAMRLGYWVEPVAGGFSLRVAASAAAEVRAQLALFDRESAGWPPRLRVLAQLRMHWPLPLAWALSNVVSYRMQLQWPRRLEDFGALRADALFGAGEVWRPFTALFLHGDLGHLVANLGSGVCMFALVLGAFGRWRGGLVLLAAAVLGNVAAAALHPWSGHAAIGASTAVFGALGVLTGSGVHQALAGAPRFSWRALFLPLIAGGALLALYGSGGLQTDVVAHTTGFAAGLVLGFVVRPADAPGRRSRAT